MGNVVNSLKAGTYTAVHSQYTPLQRKRIHDRVWINDVKLDEKADEGVRLGSRTSVRFRFGSLFSSKVVVCGHCLVTLSLKIMKH